MLGQRIIQRADFNALITALAQHGYTVVGPTVRDGAIVYDEITTSLDLPQGWTDEQEPGRYRLVRRQDEALFGYNVGPHSLKSWQLPPTQVLWRARLAEDGQLIDAAPPSDEQPRRIALIGARSCELHARDVLERVLLGATRTDPRDRDRSDALFVVAVQCGQAAQTCFCTSMGTGPEVSSGYDLLLTELLDPERHVFVAAAGTPRGEDVLSDVPTSAADQPDLEAAQEAPRTAAAQIVRTLDTTGLREMLYRNLEHPRWDEVADRCLTCGNCTMVCPTCFCTSVEDVTDLTAQHVERQQRWDSCFTIDYSHIHGGSVRSSPKARYRQWMTHKLASWVDQFGTSGCVGCGRCITWCPAAIDITEEAAAIRASEEVADADDQR